MVQDLIKNNPKIKPSEIASACLLSAFLAKENWSEVDKAVEATLNTQWLSSVKKEMKRETEPECTDLAGVVDFKQYADKRDKFNVYELNDR